MLLMVLFLVSVGYALAVAGLWLFTMSRVQTRATSFPGSLLIFGAPLCAAAALAALSFDTSPPRTVALIGARWQRAQAVTVRFIASDSGWGVHATRYRIDGGSWRTGTSARITAQGDHVILYRSIDRAGRREPVHTARVGLDDRPPTTTSDARRWMSGPALIDLTSRDEAGSGVAFTEYSIDGGAWTIGDVIHVSGQGGHVIRYRSADRLGNEESIQTRSFSVDSEPPVTQAPDAVTVGPSRQAVIGFVVNDLTPRAVVTIRITGRHGTMRCDAGIQPTNRPDAVMLTSELPYGTYRYEVLATDLAGNRSRVDGSNLLLVPAPSLVVRAWVDATAPTTGSRVIAFCLVTDQFGRPISGATVSFAWHRGTVTRHGAPMVTGRGGGAYSTLPLRGAVRGKPMKIDVTATWRGQTRIAIARFTPR